MHFECIIGFKGASLCTFLSRPRWHPASRCITTLLQRTTVYRPFSSCPAGGRAPPSPLRPYQHPVDQDTLAPSQGGLGRRVVICLRKRAGPTHPPLVGPARGPTGWARRKSWRACRPPAPRSWTAGTAGDLPLSPWRSGLRDLEREREPMSTDVRRGADSSTVLTSEQWLPMG